MTLWLRQSTARTVLMGPLVDDTDGKTAETALSIAQADIRLSKNGGDVAQSNNSAGATHDENGFYDIPLDTTDTGTLGTLRVFIFKSGALPVWQDFMVVPVKVYDSLIAGSDNLEADAILWNGASLPTIPTVANIIGGKREIVSNQLIYYDESNVEIARFDLFDADGNPAMTNVYKRTLVA
jgi:hypothetical protein